MIIVVASHRDLLEPPIEAPLFVPSFTIPFPSPGLDTPLVWTPSILNWGSFELPSPAPFYWPTRLIAPLSLKLKFHQKLRSPFPELVPPPTLSMWVYPLYQSPPCAFSFWMLSTSRWCFRLLPHSPSFLCFSLPLEANKHSLLCTLSLAW